MVDTTDRGDDAQGPSAVEHRDLVWRLREWARHVDFAQRALLLEAADRIEFVERLLAGSVEMLAEIYPHRDDPPDERR